MEWLLTHIQLTNVAPDMVFMIAVFGAGALLALGLIGLFFERDPVAERLKAAGRSLGARDLSVRYEGSKIARVLAPLRRVVTPSDETKRSVVRLRMVRAGYMNPAAAGTFHALRGALALVLPTVVLSILQFVTPGLAPPAILAIVFVSAAAGLYLPEFYISRRIRVRKREAQDGFPDALDTLLVCVEAGLSLAAAIDRVATEIGRPYPVLGEQFKLVALEIGAGKTREAALRGMAERLGVDEVNALVTLLLQSETLGTSIAQALRVHAQEMRANRLVRAEERGNKLPVKIVLPLGFCILPAQVSVIMTPLVIHIVRQILSVHVGK